MTSLLVAIAPPSGQRSLKLLDVLRMGSLIRGPSLVSVRESVAEIWINFLFELVVALESSMHILQNCCE